MTIYHHVIRESSSIYICSMMRIFDRKEFLRIDKCSTRHHSKLNSLTRLTRKLIARLSLLIALIGIKHSCAFLPKNIFRKFSFAIATTALTYFIRLEKNDYL